MSEQRREEQQRAVYTYSVKGSLAVVVNAVLSAPITSMGLVELTAGEEVTASESAASTGYGALYELAKAALVEVNGTRLTHEGGHKDALWNALNPKVRDLVIAAYRDLHQPEKEEVDSFLHSRTARVS